MAARIYMFNISVSNPRRKTMLVSKHTFSGPRIAKKDNYKYSNLILYYRGSHFFQNGRQNICVLLSQFLIDLEKKILVSKYTFSGPRITQNAIKNTLI